MLSPEEWDVLSLSLRVALGCVVITLPPAVALGWLLARRDFPFKVPVSYTHLTLPTRS